MKKKDTEYKARYNPKRECYITADGKYICYETTDLETGRPITLPFEIGKDGVTKELAVHIDELNYDMDQNDRSQDELRDPLFDAKIKSADAGGEDAADPWGMIADKRGSAEDVLLKEEEPENSQAAWVRRVIDEDCTEAQQDFFFEHFGVGTQLKVMCQAEAERTGSLPSSAAMTSRKNKIIDKVAKSFGVERVKRHKYPKKG